MQAAAQYYNVTAGPESPMFLLLYESICTEHNIAKGTSDHRAEVFKHMKVSAALNFKGSEVALRQWFSWVGAAHSHDCAFHTRLLPLIALGMVSGVY